MGGTFDPVHAAHAIERVSAAIVFQGALHNTAWLKVAQSLEQSATRLELDKYEDVVGLAPQGVSIGAIPSINFGIITGRRFSRAADGEDTLSVVVNRNSVQVESRRYIRWSGFREILKEIVERVVFSFPDEEIISQMRLDYLDRFVEQSEVSPRANWREVLREGDHISPDHLERGTAWHTHVGWFEDNVDDGRLLLNLNVDTTAESSDEEAVPRSITIFCMVNAVTPGSVARDTQAIMSRFDRLHDRSKIAVRSILTPSMQARISIDVNEDKI